MTREQAIAQSKKRWGKTAYIRAHESPSSPERRAAADEQFQAAKAALAAVEFELDERLKACEWYQELTAKKRALRKQKDEVQWHRIYKRFAVGTSNGIGFHVQGEGDTWEEAFAQADARKLRDA